MHPSSDVALPLAALPTARAMGAGASTGAEVSQTAQEEIATLSKPVQEELEEKRKKVLEEKDKELEAQAKELQAKLDEKEKELRAMLDEQAKELEVFRAAAAQAPLPTSPPASPALKSDLS